MKDFIIRMISLLKKELLVILRDKQSRGAVLIPPILQMLIFGYAASFDINSVPYGVLDNDRSEYSRDYIARLEMGGLFQREASSQSPKVLSDLLDKKDILGFLCIPEDFSRKISTGQPADVQFIADGRNSNTAGVAIGYVQQITANFNASLLAGDSKSRPPVVLETQARYNPNLLTIYFMIPAILALLGLIGTLMNASLIIAREREEGTFDQLLVAPYRPTEILLGKALTCVLLGLIQTSLIMTMILFWFKIPFHGSFFLLFCGVLLLVLSATGLGLVISSFAQSLQQAMIGTFIFIVPMTMLSGLATPISSMPEFFQKITLVNPLRYGIELVHRIFFEGSNFYELRYHFGFLAIVAAGTLCSCLIAFRKQVS